MDAFRRRMIACCLLAAGSVGLRAGPPPAAVPSARATLRRVGIRLSRSYSERVLTAMVSRGEEVVARITPAERAALGRGYLRFRVDRPVIVDVAVPSASPPFWLADQGFRAVGGSLENPDATWRLYRRPFEGGWIGLGVNGLDRTPASHYVVFVRSDSRRPPVAGAGGSRPGMRPLVELADEHRSTWRVVAAHAGVSASSDGERPFATLPGELADAWMLQPAHDRRHSTLLASGRVWKTHVVSGPRPDQVAISYGSDPGRELVWTWRTSPEVNGSAVRIAPAMRDGGPSRPPAPDEWAEVRVVTGDSAEVETPSVLNDPVVRRHRAAVGGLEPGRAYVYSLGDGTTAGWGPWKRVKTAPDRRSPVRFLYLGDAQTGLEGWGRLLESAVRRLPEVDFLVLAGDLVDRGNERTNWDHFFLRASSVFDRLPLMPCVGNHEYLDVGPRLYRSFFELPRNGPSGVDPDLVYSFEAGDACFAVLDSTLAVWDPAAARRQAGWMDATFARTGARWKIAIFHHPVYPSHPWRDMPALREHWVPVFDRHHVDLVLQGHDHAYLRTYPLNGHRRARRPDGGTIYVVAVSGDKYVDQAHRDYIDVGLTGTSTYQTIEIDPRTGRLDYRAWTEDGRVVDAFTIEKRPAASPATLPPASGRSATTAATR